jgi:hypothetical protein
LLTRGKPDISDHVIWHESKIITKGDRFGRHCLLLERKKEWNGYVFNLLNKNTAVAFRGRQRIYMALFLSKRWRAGHRIEKNLLFIQFGSQGWMPCRLFRELRTLNFMRSPPAPVANVQQEKYTEAWM